MERKTVESGGQVESLWGRIKMSDMGSRTTRERPIGALPSAGPILKKSLVQAASELTGGRYRPRTKETSQAWEYLLAFVAARVGAEQRDVLAAAAEECLIALKEEGRDLERKEKCEAILGAMDADAFAQLLNLGKRITDFTPSNESEIKMDGIEEDEGVAVVFEEEEEQIVEEVSDEELEVGIPIVRLDKVPEFEEDQDEASPPANPTTVGALSGEEPQTVDLESLAFKQGGHTMTNKKCIVPERSTKITKKGYEEIHIPAPTPKPLGPDEKLVNIGDLPVWAQSAFEGVESLNRVQSRLCRTALISDENFLLCAPTGAGKTNVALLAMLCEIGKHIKEDGSVDGSAFKIVYIAPMKALVQEMVSNFGKKLAPYGLTVSELTGDQQLTREQIAATTVLVTTPEKWDIITRKNNDTSYTRLVRLVIIDEIHLLHDDRGPVLEAIVARTLRQSETIQQWTRLVGLSATLPNYSDVGRFLRVERKSIFYFDSTFRPCPLAQQFVGVTEKRPLQRMQLMNEIAYEKVMEHTGLSQQVLVFVHSRKDTVKTAKVIRDMAISKGTIAKLLRESAASKEALISASESSKSADLQDLLSYGFAVHHAGMTRADRNLVEGLFAAGHLQVLVSTATLAWGVNLPAHTVIIKGTQVYSPERGCWTELSSQDVLQMLGRAGRPQYDTQGEGIIITTHAEVQFYLSLLNQQLPIESQLISKLVDHLNAEIVLGSIRNREDAVNWLGYTYLFVRMRKDPLLYGVTPEEVESDPQLQRRRTELIHSAALVLEGANLIRYDRRTGAIKTTEQGRISSHYYIGHASMATFNQHLRPTSTESELCRVFALSQEFKLIPVRQEEKLELAKLAERVPLPVKDNPDEPPAKIAILLQAYISRLSLEGFSLAADMVYVTQSAGRLLRAIFELCLRRGWARPASRALELCKMVEHRMWRSMTPLRQLDVSAEILRKLERKDFPFERLFDLNAAELGELVRMPGVGKTLYSALKEFPRVEVQAAAVPLTRELLRVDVTINLTNGGGLYWLTVSDVDDEQIVFADSISIPRRPKYEHQLTVYVPMTTEAQLSPPPLYFLTVTSDRWMGCEARLPIMLMDLVLPEKKGAITEVTDCRLGAENVFATHPVVQEAYAGAVFDEITSTVLPALFRSDESVFVGTKAASIPGATIVLAEFAIWRAFIQDPNARVVYISAKGGAISGVKTRWGGLFKNFVVGELTGDSATDLKLLEASNIILSEAAPFEQLTRRWRSRKTVQTISLLVIDGLHMLGGEPLLEVIASRMRFMAAQLEMPVRLVAMSAPVWNPREIAAWLGVKDTTIFNFDVMAGVGPVHVQGFSAGNMDALMASMVGPAYRAMREHGRAVIWVSDIRQAKTLALDFAALAAASNAGQQREKPDIRTGDEVMDECLAEGVAYLEDPSNQAEILSAFANGHINMLILAKEYAYLLHPLTPLTIIMGTQEYNSGQNVDYAFNDMLALATNPGGMTLIMCHASKKAALTALFGEALPVESHLDTCFTDVLNAEICAKTVTSKQDAVDYLTWTLLYRRVARNPNYYGLKVADERALSEFLSELVEGAVTELDEAKCTSIEDEGEGGEGEGEGEGEESGGERLTPMNLGLIAAYYGVKCATIEMLALSLTATSKIRGILECISAAAEFDTLSIRKGEEMILERLYERVPVRLGNPNYARDPHVKANLLLQAHFSRFTLPTALTQDLNLVLTKALSLVHAAVDVLGSYGFLIPALAAMEFSQMLIQGLWNTDPPVKQLFDGELLVKALEREITSVYDIDESLLRDLPIQEQQGIAKLVNRYPSMDVKYSLDSERVVVGEEVIVRASISRQVAVDGPVTGRFPKQKEEAWWLVVGVPTTKALLGIKRFVMNADQVDVVLPFVVEQLGPLSAKLFLVCDCYAGADQEFPISVFVERAPDDETE